MPYAPYGPAPAGMPPQMPSTHSRDPQPRKRRNAAAITGIVLAALACVAIATRAPVLAVLLGIGAIVGGGLGEWLSRKRGAGYGMQKTSLLAVLVGLLIAVVPLFASGQAATPPPAPAAPQAPAPAPAPAKTITEREWSQIAKDPNAHAGERVIVHGQIAQFDSFTGTDQFLASEVSRHQTRTTAILPS